MTEKFLWVPASNLDANDRPNNLTGAVLGGTTTTGLTNGTAYRAYVLGPPQPSLTPAAAAAPGMFGYLAWDIDPNGDIIVTTLPSGTVTAIDIEIAGGSPVELSGATPGTYSSAATPGQSVRIRGRNGSTPGDWSLAQFCPVFVDRFNRANQNIEANSNWAAGVAGSIGIRGNLVEKLTTTTVDQAWVTAAAANLANVAVEVDVISALAANNPTINIILRHPSGGNTNGDSVIVGFLAGISAIRKQTRVGTTSTTIGSDIAWTPPGAPFRVRAVCSGNTVRAFVNGVQVGTDLTQTVFTAAGRPGLRLNRGNGSPTNTVQLDNFRVIPL